MAITNVPMVRMHNARKLPLAVATAALISSPLHAAKFDVGPFEATFLSRISLGASWRTEDPSNRVVSPGNTMGQGRSPTSTTDDGNLNYDKGDMYSLLLRGLHDLDLNAGNWGVFTRVKYWYDHALAGKSVNHGHAANNYRPNSHLETGDFEPLAQEAGFRFLDYYAYGEFDIGGRPLELRAGNMVLNWGENLFIQNGVSVISPIRCNCIASTGIGDTGGPASRGNGLRKLRRQLRPERGSVLSVRLGTQHSRRVWYLLERRRPLRRRL